MILKTEETKLNIFEYIEILYNKKEYILIWVIKALKNMKKNVLNYLSGKLGVVH